MPEFNKLVEKTKQITIQFPNTYDKRSRLIDLFEEVGELSSAVHRVEGFKHSNDPAKARTEEDVADAICDCLYELILLAVDYNLDLGEEYSSMLDRLQRRLDNGEFKKKG